MTQFANIGALELNEMTAQIDDAALEAHGMLAGQPVRTNPFHVCIDDAALEANGMMAGPRRTDLVHICVDDAALEMVAESAGPQPTLSGGPVHCH